MACQLAFLFRTRQYDELTMTESIEIRNYSNVKGFPGCYANVGPFVFELIALHRKENVQYFHIFFSLSRSVFETKQKKCNKEMWSVLICFFTVVTSCE